MHPEGREHQGKMENLEHLVNLACLDPMAPEETRVTQGVKDHLERREKMATLE